jgi:hypothetical protein
MTAPAYFYQAETYNDLGEVVNATALAEVDDEGYHACCSIAYPHHDAGCEFSDPVESTAEICRHCRRDIFFEQYRGWDGHADNWLDTTDGSVYCEATLPEGAPEDTEPGLHEPDTD